MNRKDITVDDSMALLEHVQNMGDTVRKILSFALKDKWTGKSFQLIVLRDQVEDLTNFLTVDETD